VNLKSIITADISQLQRGYKQAETDAKRTAGAMDNAFKRTNPKMDFSGIKRELSRLEQQAGSTAGRVRGALSGMFGGAAAVAGGNILTSILGKVSGAMTDGVTTGVEYNKTLERSAVAFEVMTGSAEAAQAHLGELEKLALKTPFQFEDLIGASLRMQAFGYNAKEVARDLPKLSDAASIAAAGSGNFKESLDGIIIALGQMRAKGRLSFEEINQLLERGVPAWDILAKKVGKSKEEIQRLAERGKLRGDVAAELLTKGMGEYAGGVGDKLSKTTSGKESNVVDLYRKRASEDTKAIFESYGAALDEGIKGLNEKAGQSITSEVGKRLSADMDLLTELFGGRISAKEFGAALIPTIKGTFTELKGYVVSGGMSLGSALLEGFSGVLSGTGAVEAVKGWAQSAIDSAKSIFGIKSPSRVFAEIAAQNIAGFNQEWEQGKKKVSPSLVDIEKAKQKLRDDLRKLRDDPAIQAMLDTIASAEGANYNTLFGGGTFDDFGAHPNQRITRKLGGKNITSTAAGRYQFLFSTWDEIAKQLGLTDFSPESQDLAAIQLMKRRGMIGPTMRGDIETAFTKGNREWASLPGSPYGQPTKKAEDLMETYAAALERLTGVTAAAVQPIESVTVNLKQLADASLRRPGDGASAKPFTGPRAPVELPELKAVNVQIKPLAINFEKLAPPMAAINKSAPPLPPVLDKVATAMDRVTAEGDEAWKRLKGSKTFAQLQREADIDARDALDPEAAFQRFQDFKQAVGRGFDDAIQELMTGSLSWKSALLNITNDIFRSLIQEMMLAATGGKYGSIGGLIGGVLGGLFGGFFGGGGGAFGGASAGARAAGGPVSAGRAYMVGEEGPELFMPRSSGYIVNARDTERMMSAQPSQSVNVVNHFHVSAPDGKISRESQSQVAAKASQAISHANRRNN
jgi:tape measure domain-containing protein